MTPKSFYVSLHLPNDSWSELWDTAKPLKVGYGMPWTLVETERGIRILHEDGTRFKISLDPEQKNGLFDLPPVEGNEHSPGQLTLIRTGDQTAMTAKPQGLVHDSQNTEIVAFMSDGAWINDSVRVDKKLVGQAGERSVFVIKKNGYSYTFLPLLPQVELNGTRHQTPVELSHAQLADAEIRFGPKQWYFRAVHPILKIRPRLKRAQPDSEEKRQYRWILFAVFAFISIGWLLTWLFWRPAYLEKIAENKVQFAKLVITQPKPAPPPPPMPQPIKKAETEPPKLVLKEIPRLPQPMPEAALPTPPKKIQPPKLVARPAPAPARAPAPVQNTAALQAQKLQASMQKLFAGHSSGVAPIAVGAGPNKGARSQANVFDGKAQPDGIKSVALIQNQKVDVAYTDPNASDAGTSYRTDNANANITVAGNSFVSLKGTSSSVGISGSGLTKKEVWAVLEPNFEEIRVCYESALLRKPSLQGKMDLDFIIAGDGSVKKVTVTGRTLQDSSVEKCIGERVSRWQFPKPRGNIEVPVHYPVGFKRI